MRDPETFDAFYAGSVRRLVSQLYVLTGSRAEAEDVVQEACARAWQRWDRISEYGDPEACPPTPSGCQTPDRGRSGVSVTFVHQDGRTQVYGTYRATLQSGGRLTFVISTGLTRTGSYQASGFTLGKCGTVLERATTPALCEFSYSPGATS